MTALLQMLIVYDEDDYNVLNKNLVYALLLGNGIEPGTTDSTVYSHYSQLATLSRDWNLPFISAHVAKADPFNL